MDDPTHTTPARVSRRLVGAVVAFCVLAIVATIYVTWVRVRRVTNPSAPTTGPAPASPVLRR